MPYELNAVIGRFDLLRSLAAGVRGADVAPLRQGLGLVPVTRRLLKERPLAHWSRGGTVAHVEAEFHGGLGYQGAEVWRSGERVWGPVRTRDFDGPREGWPVNAALALLGVAAGAPGRDLFLEAGLGREQDAEGWQEAARWAGSYEQWHAEQERAARAAVEFERRERLRGVPAALDGRAIMALLGLPPGPLVGAATRHLQDLQLQHGPLSPEEASSRLRAWATEHQGS